MIQICRCGRRSRKKGGDERPCSRGGCSRLVGMRVSGVLWSLFVTPHGVYIADAFATNATANECNPAKTCNVCEKCCSKYITDGPACDACVKDQCSSKSNECSPTKGCNVCQQCCSPYIPGKGPRYKSVCLKTNGMNTIISPRWYCLRFVREGPVQSS